MDFCLSIDCFKCKRNTFFLEMLKRRRRNGMKTKYHQNKNNRNKRNIFKLKTNIRKVKTCFRLFNTNPLLSNDSTYLNRKTEIHDFILKQAMCEFSNSFVTSKKRTNLFADIIQQLKKYKYICFIQLTLNRIRFTISEIRMDEILSWK